MQLQPRGEGAIRFCSFECLIGHSVKRIQRRIATQNRRVRLLARPYLDMAQVEVKRRGHRRCQP